VQVPDGADAREQVKEQRRGDVVRQIADDPQRSPAPLRERSEIEPQRIRLVQAEAPLAPQLPAQEGGEIAVDLDRIE
jgi:hypothetical protein